MKIHSYINSFPDENYINFIINNYNTFDNNKHIYTKEHFEWYLSKNNAEYYECIYIEYCDIIISTLMIIKLKKNKNNIFYINFACVDKNFRNKGLVNIMINYVKKNYNNELFYFYTVKQIKYLNSYKKFNFIKIERKNCLNEKSNLKCFFKETSKFHIEIKDLKIKIYTIKLFSNDKIYNNYYITDCESITKNIINYIFNTFKECDNVFIPNYLNIDYKNLIFQKFDYNYIYLVNASKTSHLELLDTIDIF